MVVTDDGYRVVQAGELLAATDEAVKAKPSLFEALAAKTAAAPGQVR